jgi:hypothetical protein
MANHLAAYRARDREQARVADLLRLLPVAGATALDIGARDGYLSKLLAERFDHVVALDLAKPCIDHPRIECVKGDASRLDFADNSFDAVLCAEVLEHIPTRLLEHTCGEIARVAAHCAVIGVPYRQDIRLGRTLCLSCHRINPPWGHVNSFDLDRLVRLFGGLSADEISCIGQTKARTNGISSLLMDFAGHPYGTYEQDEPCVYCGATLRPPRRRTLPQRAATRTAHWLDRLQAAVTPTRANWMHVRFLKRTAS